MVYTGALPIIEVAPGSIEYVRIPVDSTVDLSGPNYPVDVALFDEALDEPLAASWVGASWVVGERNIARALIGPLAHGTRRKLWVRVDPPDPSPERPIIKAGRVLAWSE